MRERYQEQLNIDPCAAVLVNGKEEMKEVSDSYILQDGDRVNS